MNIFLRELKANLKSLLIWSGIIVLLIIMAVAKFTAFAGDPKMLAMLDSMPPAHAGRVRHARLQPDHA